MPRRRRARTAVLTGLAVALVAQLGLNVALDTVRPNWRDPEYGHRIRRLARQRRSDPLERPLLVVLGSSRAEMGLSPTHLALGDGVRAFNLSQSGAGPTWQELNFHRLVAAGLTPDFLLVEIIPALLARDDPADVSIPASTLALADLPRLAPECADFPAYRRQWIADRLVPWHSHRRLLLDHWAGETLVPARDRRNFQWTELRPDGWAPFYKADMPAEERASRTAVAEREYRPLLADYKLAPRPDRVYRRLIADAQEKGVRVAVLLMPESPGFRGWYPPGVWAESRRRVRAIAGDSRVIDAGEWVNTETDFADGHHLLGHAAEGFSRRLGEAYLATDQH